jgi:hypothetical protein
LILINPNGENEINWDPISYQLGSGDELYSTTFSGNCDGINLLPKSEEFWNCTITFNQISEPVYPDIPPQTTADSDSDGILDSFDNCPTIYNPDQEDSDGDGIGDACDSVEMVEPTEEQAPQTTADSDSDGILDSFDNCPTIFNSDQADSNGDGIGDVCEPVETTDDTVPGSTDDSTDGTAKQKQERGPGGPQQQAFTPSGNYLPPIKQMKMGVSSQEILCNEGMELIFKSSDGSPKCVSSIAAEKLVTRGWATR